jgi:hypothetical protein
MRGKHSKSEPGFWIGGWPARAVLWLEWDLLSAGGPPITGANLTHIKDEGCPTLPRPLRKGGRPGCEGHECLKAPRS